MGNCSNVKNHKIILSALSKLPKYLKWKFYHIGKEENGYPERIIAKNLKIFEKCVFLGEKENGISWLKEMIYLLIVQNTKE